MSPLDSRGGTSYAYHISGKIAGDSRLAAYIPIHQGNMRSLEWTHPAPHKAILTFRDEHMRRMEPMVSESVPTQATWAELTHTSIRIAALGFQAVDFHQSLAHFDLGDPIGLLTQLVLGFPTSGAICRDHVFHPTERDAVRW